MILRESGHGRFGDARGAAAFAAPAWRERYVARIATSVLALMSPVMGLAKRPTDALAWLRIALIVVAVVLLVKTTVDFRRSRKEL